MNLTEIMSHLSRFRVGIAGAGGLGSNCAVALARSGIGTLVICDHDIVDHGNLSRQYFFSSQVGLLKVDALKDNISMIRSDVKVVTCHTELSAKDIPVVFAGCDVIVEAFDRKEMKEMIVETIQMMMPGVPIVVGSGLAGWGDCGSLVQRKIDETLYVCGDESTEVSDDLPPLAPRVGVVANMQADTVIGILMKMKKKM